MSDPRSLVEERLTRNSWGILGSQGYVLGLDFGSYGLRASLVDLHHRAYVSAQRDDMPNTAQEIVADTIELARGLLKQHDIQPAHLMRIGAGFGGPVDARRGVVLLSHRMPGWEQFPLKETIESVFGAVTLVDNDANLIALAEATFGAGRDVQNLFYLHLSSGVGGGLVLNHHLYHGATTTAGEIGHAVVGPVDPIWPGQHAGTLEQHVSISGLLRRAAALGLQTDRLSDIFSDNPVGRQVVSETVDLLAVRLSQITALIDPHMIVIGGVVARNGGDTFIEAIRQRMRDYMAALVERQVPLVPAILGHESVAIGGLALALESLRD